MSPLASTTEVVKPFVLVPVEEDDIDLKKENSSTFYQDGWLEKVFGRQDGVSETLIQLALESLTHHHSTEEKTVDGDDEHSYQDELQKYIAESSANLWNDEEDEPLGSSDEDTSDEDADPVSISLCKAEVVDFSASIVSISSDKSKQHVTPPVEVPSTYRIQDRQGGVLVAGERVLFTNWAFKRQMRHMGRLGPLPERGESTIYELSSPCEDEEVSVGSYSGKIVEL